MASIRPVDLDGAMVMEAARLLAEFPDLDLDRLRQQLQAPRRTGRRERIDPKSWAEITAAVPAGWVTKADARKLAGLATRRAPTRRAT